LPYPHLPHHCFTTLLLVASRCCYCCCVAAAAAVAVAIVVAVVHTMSVKKRVLGMPVGMPMMGLGPQPPLSVRMFKKYDKDNSGSINYEEFKFLCYDLGHFLSDAELQMALKIIDADGSGEIDEKEFASWWNRSDRFGSIQLSDKELERLVIASEQFQRFDADSSGVLDRDEFAGLHALLIEQNLTTKPLDRCLEDLDSNRDGQISFNEYVEWLNRSGAFKLPM
jgi:Ca2+-binding EF-hand superfamily protein